MKRHELTDEQWALVEKHFKLPQAGKAGEKPKQGKPGKGRKVRSKARGGRPRRDPRVMLNGIMWILATGSAWRDLPERFGPWQTVYHHFRDWRKRGVFARVIEALQIKLDKGGLIDWDLWCVDGASVRAARAAAGADKKVSAATPTNPKTTLWAAAGAGLDRSSMWLLTARELRSRSK